MLEDLLNSIKEKKNFSILFVEDEVMIRKPMQNMMQRLCNEIVSVCDGVEALEIYNKRPFSVVITDLQMPNMNGAELCKNIRKINPEQLIVIITAYRDGQEIKQAQQYGVDYIIEKPLSIASFIEVMKKVVDRIN
ncbi:MAG: response regulator [Sulfuricurvum sp.]|nr:response regulator [Sulfuricurvum sp.]